MGLLRGVRCTSPRVDRLSLAERVLDMCVAGECMDSVLIAAAGVGDEAVVRLLLEHEGNAPRADCEDGRALVAAARGGHEALVRLLLGWKLHAPRADSRRGAALIAAAENGHEVVAALLLDWPENAPKANSQNGRALVQASAGGHEGIVRMLLRRREHAPRANCLAGEALAVASEKGHKGVVRDSSRSPSAHSSHRSRAGPRFLCRLTPPPTHLPPPQVKLLLDHVAYAPMDAQHPRVIQQALAFARNAKMQSVVEVLQWYVSEPAVVP